MLFVGVGTFIKGFDELISAVDLAAAELKITGLAQIGNSSLIPKHLLHRRFMPPEEITRWMARARLVVCHGGIGMLGEAMRAGRPIVAYPRRGPTTRDHPAGDQWPVLEKLAQRQPIIVCREPGALAGAIFLALSGPPVVHYTLTTDIPALIQGFLRGQPDASPL